MTPRLARDLYNKPQKANSSGVKQMSFLEGGTIGRRTNAIFRRHRKEAQGSYGLKPRWEAHHGNDRVPGPWVQHHELPQQSLGMGGSGGQSECTDLCPCCKGGGGQMVIQPFQTLYQEVIFVPMEVIRAWMTPPRTEVLGLGDQGE